ncbi:hypothetical protein EUGRSUZ_G01003 [Eucalyptus grandis]|uniref:Uncharacterized protein n=2 Tax=Eucalyptus grandis TaxID=71139 RepID=A0ACC3K1D4_EUCGR|nr:hypothetical protein EUGRSUZ_G01003 [Eucalyptus grandis]
MIIKKKSVCAIALSVKCILTELRAIDIQKPSSKRFITIRDHFHREKPAKTHFKCVQGCTEVSSSSRTRFTNYSPRSHLPQLAQRRVIFAIFPETNFGSRLVRFWCSSFSGRRWASARQIWDACLRLPTADLGWLPRASSERCSPRSAADLGRLLALERALCQLEQQLELKPQLARAASRASWQSCSSSSSSELH